MQNVSSQARFDLTGTLLLIGVTTALVTLVAGLVVRFVPAWQPATLVLACLIVATEAALVRYRMLQGRHVQVGALSYLGAELFALLVVMRVAATLGQGQVDLPTLLARWVQAPLDALDGVLLLYLLAGFVAAVLVRLGLKALAALEPPTHVGRAAYALDEAVARAAAEADERATAGSLSLSLTWGGVLALLLLSGQLADLGPFGGPPTGLPPAMALAGVAYLGCAVLLHSRARLGLLRITWRRDEATVEGAVLGRWAWLSGGLVLLLVALGAILPLSSGSGLVELARSGAVSVINLLSMLALAMGVLTLGLLGILIAIPALLIGWLASWSGMAVTPSATPLQLPTPVPPPPPPPSDPPILPGLIFWFCIALLALYALWTVLRRQQWAVTAAQRLRSLTLVPLLAWWQRVWGGATRYAHMVGAALADQMERRWPAEPAAAPPRPRWGRMAPAERVRYLYLVLLDYAAQAGIGRAPTATPAEYGNQLAQQIPEQAEDVRALTEAYQVAVYSPHPTSSATAAAARKPWARLVRALRQVRR
ncbi:MAG: DUF4129 domain-containing protein [Oscillochloridaceae bacterium umkhey_bin13]